MTGKILDKQFEQRFLTLGVDSITYDWWFNRWVIVWKYPRYRHDIICEDLSLGLKKLEEIRKKEGV